jgi:hypothetical protein
VNKKSSSSYNYLFDLMKGSDPLILAMGSDPYDPSFEFNEKKIKIRL